MAVHEQHRRPLPAGADPEAGLTDMTSSSLKPSNLATIVAGELASGDYPLSTASVAPGGRSSIGCGHRWCRSVSSSSLLDRIGPSPPVGRLTLLHGDEGFA